MQPKPYPFTTKIGISNSKDAPLIVAVEPWANDYTLLPGEELSVEAYGDTSMPWFFIVEWNDTSQVYCNDTMDFKVVQGDRELECGHNRQA